MPAPGNWRTVCAIRCRRPACSFPIRRSISWRRSDYGAAQSARRLVANLDELHAVAGRDAAGADRVEQQTYLAPYTAARDIEIVGPKVGADLRSQAINATFLRWPACWCIFGSGSNGYMAWRAVIAVFHDTLITIGMFSFFNKEITLTVIAALLTLVGYSMNDTIVIFDRIRENLQLNRRERLVDVINRSVNQTLSRTVMTSGLTFLTVIALFLFGGPVLHGFSFALVVGIIVGRILRFT